MVLCSVKGHLISFVGEESCQLHSFREDYLPLLQCCNMVRCVTMSKSWLCQSSRLAGMMSSCFSSGSGQHANHLAMRVYASALALRAKSRATAECL